MAIETKITSADARAEAGPRTVVGIWLIIMAPGNRIFVVKNLKPKNDNKRSFHAAKL